MYLLFDSAGKFLAGRILSETDASAQVELDSGKRVKVKNAHHLLRFDAPDPAELMARAEREAAALDPAMAWEFAPEEEFGFQDFAALYFGDQPSPVQQAAALFALHAVPHYFRRAAKGHFRKAPADIVERALAAIAKKERIAAQITEWSEALAAGTCPAPIRAELYKILFKPDKNAPEYKAVVAAARATKKAPLTLLSDAGAIRSAYQFHWQRFLFENFPEGTGFPEVAAPSLPDDLPLADVGAFSIDDRETTELDDAFSVRGLGNGAVVVGIHIAAPGLAIQPGDALDAICRARLSTVYMPGYKLTMLPPDVVHAYTLAEGRATPALSLYLTFDPDTLEIRESETRLERVTMAANLRYGDLDDAGIADAAIPLVQNPAVHVPEDLREQLGFLLRLALELKTRREQLRGKPFIPTHPDYSFHLRGGPGGEPTGEEHIDITSRPRGAPLDLIVSELMILANSTWGAWLKTLGVPAIYRTQASLAPGVKVRMGTRALPHAGMGVSCYAWSTSPLRRYVDLANQWQLVAAARHGKTAALAAPFKPRDTELLAIISAFDAAYGAYQRNQSTMERYWALRYLKQEGLHLIAARLLREQSDGTWLVRADGLPLVFPVLGARGLPRGTHVRAELGDIDLIALDVRGSIVDILTGAPEAPASADDEDDDETNGTSAGPVALALDVNEPDDPQPGDGTPQA